VDLEQELSIRDETAPGGPILLVVAGELDLQSAGDLRTAVRARIADAPSGLVIDLSAVPFLDSSAVGALLEAAATIRDARGGFAIVVGGDTQSRSRLDLTGTSRVLNVCHDREEALEVVGKGAGQERRESTPATGDPQRTVTLTLFLNAASPHSTHARAAVEGLRARLPPRAVLEIVDVAERPDLAERHRVLATPMVVRSGPPHRRVVGDLSNLDEVLLALDLPTVAA
jgi:circadian clock protein KaiB